jgi:hypothetical protein
LLDNKRNDDILGQYEADPFQNKLTQYKQKWVVLSEWKALDTRNKSLTTDLPENEDLYGR